MPSYTNLDKAKAFAELSKTRPAAALPLLLSAERVKTMEIPMAGGLHYNYAAKFVDKEVLKALQALSDEMETIEKFKCILSGETMNTGEKRKVLHHLCRGRLLGPVICEGRDQADFYAKELGKIKEFADSVHSGAIRGSTGKAFGAVCQIGIGGSDLGPRALYLALEAYFRERGGLKLRAEFISNVDPDDANLVLSRLDLESTLFILVSKSGTTQETLANETFVRRKLESKGLDPNKHLVAVTSESSPLAGNPRYAASFYIDDYVGGRFSSTSAVGGAVLSLAFGPEAFSSLLKGANQEDRLSLESDISKNPALMDALIGLYERNVLGYPATAIIPYSQALSRFPAHLQQADMESNGKQVNRNGEAIAYPTGPVIFGEPGTNGQHSFFQLLHQGTDIVPLQFIGFKRGQTSFDVDVEGSSSQSKLKANLAAQIVAFAAGRKDSDPNRNFPGGRPSSLIWGEGLGPEALGALLAHYENKIMFQGFLWNLNSFDQEGVQLGKLLTKKVLSGGDMDPALKSFAELLGV
jgi:glucose-6-phosphate isomerase